MAAFDFPASPTNGQTYSLNGVTFTYNGYGWRQQGSSMAVLADVIKEMTARIEVLEAKGTTNG